MTPPPYRFALSVLLLAAIAVSSACQNKAKPTTVPDTTQTTAEAAAPPPPPPAPATAEPFPRTDVDKAPVETSIDELNRSGVLKTVYFAYNSDEIDAAAKAILQ